MRVLLLPNVLLQFVEFLRLVLGALGIVFARTSSVSLHVDGLVLHLAFVECLFGVQFLLELALVVDVRVRLQFLTDALLFLRAQILEQVGLLLLAFEADRRVLLEVAHDVLLVELLVQRGLDRGTRARVAGLFLLYLVVTLLTMFELLVLGVIFTLVLVVYAIHFVVK